MIDQAPSPDARFASLVLAIKSGCRVDMAEISAVLAGSGRSHRDLVEALVSRPRSVQPGDRCDRCAGKLGVYHTHVADQKRVQYLRCRSCGTRPENNKRVLLLQR